MRFTNAAAAVITDEQGVDELSEIKILTDDDPRQPRSGWNAQRNQWIGPSPFVEPRNQDERTGCPEKSDYGIGDACVSPYKDFLALNAPTNPTFNISETKTFVKKKPNNTKYPQ
eukprot:scaffold105351_cov55-Attheya_sp.AAC.7